MFFVFKDIYSICVFSQKHFRQPRDTITFYELAMESWKQNPTLSR